MAAGYMSNKQVPLSRAQRRKAGKKPAAPVAPVVAGDPQRMRELARRAPKLTITAPAGAAFLKQGQKPLVFP